jgi:hypothetical protein
MTRYLAGCLLLTALCSVPGTSFASPVFGDSPAVYDTVDAVETAGNRIIVTGIISGQSTVSETIYVIQDFPMSSTSASAARCDRLALLAIAKPGKYQFAITRSAATGDNFGCKLIVRNP